MGARTPKWLTHNLGLKVWSFVIAALLWFHVTTEKVVEESFRIPLEIFGVPDELVLVSEAPEHLQVKIKGKGKQILRLRVSKGLIGRVDLSKGRRGEVGFKISPEMVAFPAWTSARVSQIVEPRELRLVFDREASKSVKVLGTTAGSPRGGYVRVGTLVVEPPEVIATGGREKLREIEMLETEAVDISGLARTLTRRVRVVPPADFGFSCQPESVEVTVPIDELIQRTFSGIPVTFVNLPRSALKAEPPSMTVVLSGPRGRMEELQAEEISATIDLKAYPSGGDSLRATVKPPEGISLVSLEPEFFKVE